MIFYLMIIYCCFSERLILVGLENVDYFYYCGIKNIGIMEVF